MAAAFPEYHTFVHFSCNTAQQRSQSAPPEYHIHLAIECAIKQEGIINERVRLRALRTARKWKKVVLKAWDQNQSKALDDAEDVVAESIEQTTPHLRLTMPRSLFKTYCYHLFGTEGKQEQLLRQIGVFRLRGNEVQLWCANKPLEDSGTMRALFEEAQRCREVYEMNSINLLCGDGPLVVKYSAKYTLDSLRKLVFKHTKIPHVKQRLLHLGAVLKPGLLVNQGLCAGSCVVVKVRD